MEMQVLSNLTIQLAAQPDLAHSVIIMLANDVFEIEIPILTDQDLRPIIVVRATQYRKKIAAR